MRNWGYKNIDGGIDLASDYGKLVYDLETLIAQGLSAAIYTQTTDVEGEVNGLITYDRKMTKLPASLVNIMHSRLYNIKPAIAVELITNGQGGAKNKREISINGNKQQLELPFVQKEPAKLSCTHTFNATELYKNLSLWIDVSGQTKIWLNGTKIFDTEVRSTRHYNQFNISNFSYLLQKGENKLSIEVEQKAKNAKFDFGLTAF